MEHSVEHSVEHSQGDPELARQLRLNIPSTLERWEQLTRAEIPAAHNQDRFVLRDNMPTFLENMARAIETGAIACEPVEVKRPSVEHAEARAHLDGYTLDQVIHEYQLLRVAMVECTGIDATSDGMSTLHRALDFGIRESASHYALRMQTDLLTVVAHEMRTSLKAIANALYILESMKFPSDLPSHQIGVASRQIEQLDRLVDDLLDARRIEQGKIDLRLEAVDLNDVARFSAETVHSLAETQGQDITIRLFEAHRVSLNNNRRLEQAVTNLLNNALKFTEPGGDIWLSVGRTGDEAFIEVRDSGIGIDTLILPQIFDRFNQVDPATAQAHGGLGIGLAIVRRLVEIHGGKITAQSAGPGAGSAFTVHLPVEG